MKETLEEKLLRLKKEKENLILERYYSLKEFDRKLDEYDSQIYHISQEFNRIQIALSN
jgi:hypothetical protein